MSGVTVLLAKTPPPLDVAPLYLQYYDDIIFTAGRGMHNKPDCCKIEKPRPGRVQRKTGRQSVKTPADFPQSAR